MEMAEPTCWEVKERKREISSLKNGNQKKVFYTYLIVDGVKLGQNDAINQVWIVLGRVISQSCIEFDQLVNGFIAD